MEHLSTTLMTSKLEIKHIKENQPRSNDPILFGASHLIPNIITKLFITGEVISNEGCKPS